MLTNRISIFSPKTVQCNSAPIPVGKKISKTCIFSMCLTFLYKDTEKQCELIPGADKPSGATLFPFLAWMPLLCIDFSMCS